MAYEYDVFISYRRQRLKTEWLVDMFLPLFEEYLGDEIAERMQRPLGRIFFDQREIDPALREFDNLRGIEPGANWQASLRQAIKTSTCMLGVWSPTYFFSDWCNVEWRSFLRRQELTQLQTIVPISIRGGSGFPADARLQQRIDLSNYNFIGEGFRRTELFVELQRHVRSLATAVARTIELAPAYQDWPIVDVAAPPAPPIEMTSFAHGSQ
jgi:hypothetical protein